MSIAALLKRGKLWNQPRGASLDEWIKKIECIYITDHCSDRENKEISAVAK